MARIKGQVSLFIIMGIVILLIFIFILFILFSNPQPIERGMEDTDTRYMNGCLEEKAWESLLMAGKTGGKFEEEVRFTGNLDYSGLYNIAELEERIENHFLEIVENCKENNLTEGEVIMNETSVNVDLEEWTVFKINNPYSIEYVDGFYSQNEMILEFDTRIYNIYEMVEHILDYKPVIHDKGPMKEEGFKIEFIEKEDYIFCAIEDRRSSREYIFTFAFEK